MRKCLLALLLGISLSPVFSQINYPGSLKITDPVFNRPDEGTPPTTLSTIFKNVHYNVISINVAAAGLITFSSNSIWDNFAILYSPGGFIPASPLTNALVANDDFGGPNFGFTYNFTIPGVYYLVICSFKNNITGPYTVTQSATVVLPLRLVSFTASNAGGNGNIIKWKSEEESSLISYQVQRSLDDYNFIDLTNGRIAAKNNTAATTYSFMDAHPGSGYNYYRLKITEKTGLISYSPIALVKNNKMGITNLKVFPNPASDYLQIEVKSAQNIKALIYVINGVGEIVNKGQYNFNSQGIVSLDIKILPAGKYFLRTIIDSEETTMVFIKN